MMGPESLRKAVIQVAENRGDASITAANTGNSELSLALTSSTR
jgi:hypothetical protein